jgi:hypothetical protein
MQRPPPLPRVQRLIGLIGTSPCRVTILNHQGTDLRIITIDAVEVELEQLARSQGARPHCAGEFDSGLIPERLHAES